MICPIANVWPRNKMKYKNDTRDQPHHGISYDISRYCWKNHYHIENHIHRLIFCNCNWGAWVRLIIESDISMIWTSLFLFMIMSDYSEWGMKCKSPQLMYIINFTMSSSLKGQTNRGLLLISAPELIVIHVSNSFCQKLHNTERDWITWRKLHQSTGPGSSNVRSASRRPLSQRTCDGFTR